MRLRIVTWLSRLDPIWLQRVVYIYIYIIIYHIYMYTCICTHIYIYVAILVQAVLIHLKMTVMQQVPYGQRNMGSSLVAYSNPRGSLWGQPETSEEWPIGGVLVLSNS